MECNLDCLTHQDDGQKLIANKASNGQKVITNKATDVSMELIYKELNDLKVKGKVYDMFLIGSTCFIILLMVLIAAVILGSNRN